MNKPLDLGQKIEQTSGNRPEIGAAPALERLAKPLKQEHGLPKIIKFESLVRCGDEVWIEHAGQIYRLRRTRNDKLIMTK